MPGLKGKSLIVTGGAFGIGRAAVLAAAEQGARLIVADVQEDGGEAVCAEIRAAGGEARFVRADMTQESDIRAMVDAAVDTYGRLDGAFNNAGISNANIPLLEMPESVFLHTHKTNSVSVFLCMKYEAMAMLRTGGGAIVNTSSTAAVSTLPNMTDYGSAKASVLALTRSAALELARQGIRVNAILPGPTHSKSFDEGVTRVEGLVDYLQDRQPMGRIADPREVAIAALWLLSDDASIVTGAVLPADGGLSML